MVETIKKLTCDKCGSTSNVASFYVETERYTDAAGSRDTWGESFELCHECCLKVLFQAKTGRDIPKIAIPQHEKASYTQTTPASFYNLIGIQATFNVFSKWLRSLGYYEGSYVYYLCTGRVASMSDWEPGQTEPEILP